MTDQSKAEKLWGFDPLKPKETIMKTKQVISLGLKMKYAAVYFQTCHGRAACVVSANTDEKLKKILDSFPRSHNNNDIGMVGLLGWNTFDEAVDDCIAWEHWEPKNAAPRQGTSESKAVSTLSNQDTENAT